MLERGDVEGGPESQLRVLRRLGGVQLGMTTFRGGDVSSGSAPQADAEDGFEYGEFGSMGVSDLQLLELNAWQMAEEGDVEGVRRYLHETGSIPSLFLIPP